MEHKPKTPEEVIFAIACCYPEQGQPSGCGHCPYSESERCCLDLAADAQALLLAAYGKHVLIQQLREAHARCQEGGSVC